MAATKRNGAGPPREKPQQIADELRSLIVSGALSEGDSLGREPDLVERFGVSRPSLREALRILEAEGLITVVRGVRGGIVVHEPDERLTARTAALVLAARNVSLADVFEARTLLEPVAAKALASRRDRRSAVSELEKLVDEEIAAIDEPARFATANAAFHERLVALAGNQTLSIVAEMLTEIVTRAVTAVSSNPDAGSGTTRAPRHPVPAAAARADQGRGRRRRRGALAIAHGGGRQGDARPRGVLGGRPPAPQLRGQRRRHLGR